MAMFTRTPELPPRSFFLFGPRGTGKTTWLRSVLPRGALWFDLLLEREYLRLLRDPGAFSAEVRAHKHGTWIVVDEVQRVPAVLDEVQDLLAREPDAFRFALTGSSARKLRRTDGNLLPGRVVNRRFFPLTAAEFGDAVPPIDSLLVHGGLPAIRDARHARTRDDMLQAYVDNYLTQEVRAEALAKRLDAFVRFLEVASIANGQVTNIASIARDAAVARPTVQGYFEVLVDTLIGVWLPSWRPRAKIKETAHPKFYFFDTGVVRALGRRLGTPLDSTERGPLLETWVLHELRAFMDHSACGGELGYWRTPSGSEVDFVWSRGSSAVGIEVKASERWRSEEARPLQSLLDEKVIQHGCVAYLGDRSFKLGRIDVLPLRTFLERLYAGEVLRR